MADPNLITRDLLVHRWGTTKVTQLMRTLPVVKRTEEDGVVCIWHRLSDRASDWRVFLRDGAEPVSRAVESVFIQFGVRIVEVGHDIDLDDLDDDSRRKIAAILRSENDPELEPFVALLGAEAA